MKLTVNHIGKINKAEIEFNGITVIAGENNTGKSTISKILYSMYNSNYQFEDYIQRQKVHLLNDDISNLIKKHSYGSDSNIFYTKRRFTYFIDPLLNIFSSENEAQAKEKIGSFVNELKENFDSNLQISDPEELCEDIFDSVSKIQNIDVKDYLSTRVYNYFNYLFGAQIINVNATSPVANSVLNIKDKAFCINFDNRSCNISINFAFTNKALFIDSLKPVDFYTSNFKSRTHLGVFSSADSSYNIASLMAENRLDSQNEDVVGKTIYEKKAFSALNVIAKAFKGHFEKNGLKESFCFSEDSSNIFLENLSSGIKSFVIIKKLLENGQINERDVLILDEPEISLHPAWQVIFAELIVILQKEFNLTVLLSTHSPYFLSALEAYSKKYQVVDKCKYYLSETEGSSSTFLDVTNNTEKIYTKLAKPFDSISMIESEM